VLRVNLQAIIDINAALGVHDAHGSDSQSAAAPTGVRLADGGRVVVLSSINGIAGAFGQTNYAFTKRALMQ